MPSSSGSWKCLSMVPICPQLPGHGNSQKSCLDPELLKSGSALKTWVYPELRQEVRVACFLAQEWEDALGFYNWALQPLKLLTFQLSIQSKMGVTKDGLITPFEESTEFAANRLSPWKSASLWLRKRFNNHRSKHRSNVSRLCEAFSGFSGHVGELSDFPYHHYVFYRTYLSGVIVVLLCVLGHVQMVVP